MTSKNNLFVCLYLVIILDSIQTESQSGQAENQLSLEEWFFRRMLSIVLKGGQSQLNEDGSMDVSVQMKFEPTQWKIVEECIKSETPLPEDMLRKSMGYVQDSIYAPSIVEENAMAWWDYVLFYPTEYKIYITGGLGFLAVVGAVFWLWCYKCNKNIYILVLLIFFAYEVVIAYKEAEKIELEKFQAAIDQCKWFFWKSSYCEVPAPDTLMYLKHMHPQKIAVRMCTTVLVEPFLALSGALEVIFHVVTDGLWYPFNKITYSILMVVIKIFLIILQATVIFNWLLNITFFRQKERTVCPNEETQSRITDDRANQAIIDRVLDDVGLALANNHNNVQTTEQRLLCSANRIHVQHNRHNRKNVNKIQPSTTSPKIRRSASTGRFPDRSTNDNLALDSVRRPDETLNF